MATNLAPLSELDDLRHQFRRIEIRARDLLTGLSEMQFHWQPSPREWSIGQCLSHLIVTGRLYTPLIATAIRASRASGLCGNGPYRCGLLGRLAIRSMEAGSGWRFRAPKSLAPERRAPVYEVVTAFMKLQEDFAQQVEDSQGLDLSRVRIKSPVSRLLRLNLMETFAFHAAHERRHLAQAERLRRREDFPL